MAEKSKIIKNLTATPFNSYLTKKKKKKPLDILYMLMKFKKLFLILFYSTLKTYYVIF